MVVKEKNKEEMFGEAVVFPPQSSIEIESHGSGDKQYYTWRIKVYCDDLDMCMTLLKHKNAEMKKYVEGLGVVV